jgi:futalosine hydrolase
VRLLVVTAVAAERDAILAALTGAAGAGELTGSPASVLGGEPVLVGGGWRVHVVAGGAGPAEAAAATVDALRAVGDAELVISAGIAGGFASAPSVGLGHVAVASSVAFADLGAQTAAGFESATELGFGRDRYDVDPAIAALLEARTHATVGQILTVASVTGTGARAAELRARHPDAVAEAMEGAGVAAGAARVGVPFAEVRAISNIVGPRDRAAWQIGPALDALGRAFVALTAEPWPS